MSDAEIRRRARKVADEMAALMKLGVPKYLPVARWLEDWLATFGQQCVEAREWQLAQMARDTGTNELIRFAEIIEGADGRDFAADA